MTEILSGTYFTSTDNAWFTPTDHSRGPWDENSCHAGPPTAMLARAMEVALNDAGSDHALVRISVDLMRPVPMAGFRTSAHVVRQGRSLTMLQATLTDGQGRERVTANGMALRVDESGGALPTCEDSLSDTGASLATATSASFPIARALHNRKTFKSSVETRYPPGESPTPGPTTAWMRTVPMLASEEPSAFQRICPLADSGNAFSRNTEPWQTSFVNPDLTLILHRAPQGEWLGSRSLSHWQPTGIGLAQAELFDQHGVVGIALQTLLLTRQSGRHKH